MKITLITLPIFIVLDWTREFTIHTNASNYAIGTMSTQNLDNTIDKPNYYANQLMTRA
jgi:hypothetical protein